MLKHEIRKLYLHKRKALSDRKVKEFNQKIKFQFDNFLQPKIKTVHIYLPIQSKSEIDTWPIIHGLWEKHIRVVAPVMAPQKNTMGSWLLTKETRIVANDWEVPEPGKSSKIEDNEIDLIIVPLLAFDKKGYRVGYGKGYYDKFIASIDRKVLKIGLSFFSPLDHITDLDPWDIPLDYCITPGEIIKF